MKQERDRGDTRRNGSDEATLFASEVLRMYQRYSERQRWRFEILEASESGAAASRSDG